MTQCLFLTKDLLFSSRVDSLAKQLGIPLRMCAELDSGADAAIPPDTSLVLVDLTLPDLDVGQVVSSLREQTAESALIVAFGPHVHEGALQAARQAGCDQVLSRGEFNNRMAEILENVDGDRKSVS